MSGDKRKRILYITPTGERGGAETVLLNILRHLDRQRFNPSVICFQEGDFVNELKQKANVEVVILPAARFRNLRESVNLIRQIKKIIKEENIHLVHANGTGAHLFGGLAARLCNIPNLYHIHDQLEWSWNLQGALNKLALLIPSSQAIAVSQYAEKSLRRNFFSPTNLRVIHNALTEGAYSASADIERTKIELGWKNDSPLIVWCGRLQRWKGTHVFIKSAATVIQQIPAARFLIVGGSLFGIESDYEKELHVLVKEFKLEDEVRFTGHIKNVGRYLAAADLVVHSSIEPEPFGMVILEAMALGKPVIASNLGGPVEIVEPHQTGLLVEPNNHPALAEAMIHLLNDEERRVDMGNAGRRRAEKDFSISQMMLKLETLYEEILSQSANSTNRLASIVEG